MEHFDLVIVGTGSGNSLVTPELADWRIAIVEQGVFGGTCVNVGCIPTKMFVYPADLAASAGEWARLNLHGPAPRADWRALRDRIFGRIDAIAAGGREYRATGSPNVSLFEAHAEFTGPKTLRLSTGETLTADHIVLATGTRATVPDVVTRGAVPFHTSDTIMRIDDLPDRLVILGGGFVAAEFAHVFSAFGVHITVLARSGLLRHLDHEVTARFTELVRDRWHLRSGVHPTAVRGGDGDMTLDLDDGTSVSGDLLLVATGRVPNGDRLGLAAGGVGAHEDGRIIVDKHQRTSVPGVWALGDASSDHLLKHVANHEARVVAHNLAHPDALMASDHRYVPAAVFTHPQLASVGLTEEEAVASGQPHVTATAAYGGTAYGWAMADTTSVCKLVADPAAGALLGAHLMGEQAATLIQPLIQAMSFGLGVREMARGQYWIHPALTEVVENALLALPSRSDGSQLAEVEPHPLVVGALAGDPVRLALRVGGSAAARAHRGHRPGNVVDPPHRHGRGPLVPTAQADHRDGVLDLPAVGDPPGRERPAQHCTVERASLRRIADLEREVGEVAGPPAVHRRSLRAALDLMDREPGALVVGAVGTQAIRFAAHLPSRAACRDDPGSCVVDVVHRVDAQQRRFGARP